MDWAVIFGAFQAQRVGRSRFKMQLDLEETVVRANAPPIGRAECVGNFKAVRLSVDAVADGEGQGDDAWISREVRRAGSFNRTLLVVNVVERRDICRETFL